MSKNLTRADPHLHTHLILGVNRSLNFKNENPLGEILLKKKPLETKKKMGVTGLPRCYVYVVCESYCKLVKSVGICTELIRICIFNILVNNRF